ncbi:MAG: hypothetical protein AB7O74_03500 [Candidatus Nanopelagicales bacterium]
MIGRTANRTSQFGQDDPVHAPSTFTQIGDVRSWLSSVDNMFEALMTDLRLTQFGYAVRVAFEIVIDVGGRSLGEPIPVVFELEAVHELALVGALTEAMREHPESINWGLSEVARVRVEDDPRGIRLEAIWEGDRRVTVVCDRLRLTVALA